ncbi:NAD-P-binding protein [Dentipellis sp. KUC8613]|nr:NAD-P-binding protein [Dentipellis sp. KUC8613]
MAAHQISQRVVLCGAGFLGRNIVVSISKNNAAQNLLRRVQISSRHPERVHGSLKHIIPSECLLPPVKVDVTKPEILAAAFEGADVVVSLVGILNGSREQFDEIQWRGAENVAKAAKQNNAKVIHISAIGADKTSSIPYEKTKALGEEAVFTHCPDATIIRPSLIFGPGDEFFNRFATLSYFLPILPVFGNGKTRFQPVYVGDVAELVEILTRKDNKIRERVAGKIIEAGGPEVFTFRQIMELVLKYTGRTRPIVPVPWSAATLQAMVLERLPHNVFTISQSQVEQLKHDNVESSQYSPDRLPFAHFMEEYSHPLTSVHDVLPRYLK